jgi:putative ABC transport system permease protein
MPAWASFRSICPTGDPSPCSASAIIRRAIGATRRDILLQFLFEAIIVSGIGGLIGILLAQFGSGFIGNLMDTEVTVESGIMLMSLAFSVIVGVGFGIYPAIKASKLNPIEALRYE